MMSSSRHALRQAWAEWGWFWRRWWLFTTAAEFVGFAMPALTGLVAWRLGLPPIPFYISMTAAGAAEGALLGAGQRRALDPVIPVSAKWTIRTAAAAAGAWAIGMLPNTLIDLSVPIWLALALSAPLAPVLLFSIGFAQWTLLRRHVPGAWRWIPANGVAWLIALPPTFIAPALLPADAAVQVYVVSWLAAGLVMAAIVAAITGLAVVLLLRGATAPDESARAGEPSGTQGTSPSS